METVKFNLPERSAPSNKNAQKITGRMFFILLKRDFSDFV
jgi:hypothetical protein